MHTKPSEAVNARMGYPPKTDIYRNDAGYTLILDLPGVPKDQLSVTTDGDKLSISGQRRALDGSDQMLELRRSFDLAPNIDTNNIGARFTDGVLTLDLPFVPEEKPKPITIQ